jgi:hypothetical protein
MGTQPTTGAGAENAVRATRGAEKVQKERSDPRSGERLEKERGAA